MSDQLCVNGVNFKAMNIQILLKRFNLVAQGTVQADSYLFGYLVNLDANWRKN